MMRIARPDADTLLARALIANAAQQGITLAVRDWRSRPWASATFVGARHQAVLDIAGEWAGWLATLPEAELSVRGHLLADLDARVDAAGRLALEALTVVDD